MEKQEAFLSLYEQCANLTYPISKFIFNGVSVSAVFLNVQNTSLFMLFTSVSLLFSS